MQIIHGKKQQFTSQLITKENLHNHSQSFLLDEVYPGETLVITFGFVSWDQIPEFDFWGRLKKMETISNEPLNKLLIRDIHNDWYQRGINGLGDNIIEVVESIKDIIDFIKPKKIITIGQSMGGYGAVMYGSLLNADNIIAFGPLSFLDTQLAIAYNDKRWFSIMQKLENNPPSVWYQNLPALVKTLDPNKTSLDIIFGTMPSGTNTSEAVCLDAMHAHRFSVFDNSHFHPYPYSGHIVVQHLIDTKRINRLLTKILYNIDLGPDKDYILAGDWLNWIQRNLDIGNSFDNTVEILLGHGYQYDNIIHSINFVMGKKNNDV